MPHRELAHLLQLHPAPDTPKGVALVFHGLNLAPHCMDPLCEALSSWGIESYRVSLKGHGPNHPSPAPSQKPAKARLEASKSVDATLWLEEAKQAYQAAHERATSLGVPLFVSGFSLGGLVAASLAQAPSLPSQPDKMLLFAPAIRIKPFAQLLHGLRPMRRLVLPSGSPAPYRANWGTSIAAYNALLDLHKAFHQQTPAQLTMPTLVLVHPRDEFIPHKKIQALIDQHNLDQWSLQLLDKQPTYKGSPHHLIIDEPSLGPEPWREMLAGIRSFLLD